MSHLDKFLIYTQRVLPNALYDKFTTNVCPRMGKASTQKDKLEFAEHYKLRWKQAVKCQEATNLEQCVSNFKDLNDLFSRKILPHLTKPDTNAKNKLVSPAESHMRGVKGTDTFEIKGANYTTKTLFKTKVNPLPDDSILLIFRLAPDDYHRIHSPTDSRIVSIKNITGKYQSVHPILLEHEPVLQENHRKIITFANGIQMIVIGATCVGTIALTVKPGDHVKHGDDMGTFLFGGSCIVIAIPHATKHLKYTSTKERDVRPGQWIADFNPSHTHNSPQATTRRKSKPKSRRSTLRRS